MFPSGQQTKQKGAVFLTPVLSLLLVHAKTVLKASHLKKGDTIAEYVQVLNPKTKRYKKVNITTGEIVSHKSTPGPYKFCRIVKSVEGIHGTNSAK